MTTLFSDTTKFKTVSKNNTLIQLTTLQNCLHKIYNRNEITKDQYDNIRPVSTKPARARTYTRLTQDSQNLRLITYSLPIIDTTGTAYQPVAKCLTKLLNPITTNEFTVKDSFDAVITSITFHVTFLMTDIDLFLLTSRLFLLITHLRKLSTLS